MLRRLLATCRKALPRAVFWNLRKPRSMGRQLQIPRFLPTLTRCYPEHVLLKMHLEDPPTKAMLRAVWLTGRGALPNLQQETTELLGLPERRTPSLGMMLEWLSLADLAPKALRFQNLLARGKTSKLALILRETLVARKGCRQLNPTHRMRLVLK